MARLNKRETIIIIVAIAAVIYGAYALLFSGGKGKDVSPANPAATQNYMNSIAGDLLKNPLNPADAYIAERAEADWGKNPFWEKDGYREWASRDEAKTKSDPVAKIIYSGYVAVGKKKMAVINGLEYSVGDKLEPEGYVLKKITESKVVIGAKNKGSELEILIQE